MIDVTRAISKFINASTLICVINRTTAFTAISELSMFAVEKKEKKTRKQRFTFALSLLPAKFFHVISLRSSTLQSNQTDSF